MIYIKRALILLNILIFISLFFAIYYIRTNRPSEDLVSNTIQPSTPSNQNALPISLGQPNVANATTFYTITGRIKTLSSTSLTIDSDTNDLPSFPISSKTQYYKSSVGKGPSLVAKEQIKEGSLVIVTASYNYEKKLWITNRITLNEHIAPTK